MAGLALAIVGLAALMPDRADAASIVLTPRKDNTIYANANLSSGAGAFLFAGLNGPTGGQRVLRSLIAFDLAQIPAGATVNSVILTLGINTPHDDPDTVELHRVLADWGEGTSVATGGGGGGAAATTGDVTWTARFFNTALWTTPGGDFSSVVSAAQSVSGRSGTATFASTGLVADVQAWVDHPASNFGWLLKAQNEALAAVRFASRESAPAPSLQVTYTPAPPNVIPAIATQPRSLVVNPGATASFSVVATGTPSPSFQWRLNGTAIDGATNPALTLMTVPPAKAGNYDVVVTNVAGSVTSAVATLTVDPGPSDVITTLAGLAAAGSSNGIGGAALFAGPTGVAVDASGNVFIADTLYHTIRRITPGGVVTTLAGAAGNKGGADGTGATARFSSPGGMAVDANGNIFVADTGNHAIRKIGAGGVVTTLAGVIGSEGSADGVGGAARFSNPLGVAVDGSGNVWVADSGNFTIRKIAANGAVTTLAGAPGIIGSTDGTGSAAHFALPGGIALDGSGNVFVADQFNFTIRRITAAGVVTTIAGTTGVPGSADGVGGAAQFGQPRGVAVDASGNIFVADRNNSTIRRVAPDGAVSIVAGATGSSGYLDARGSAARFAVPQGLAVDGSGNLFVADTGNSTVRKITTAGDVTTLAGRGGGGAGWTDGLGGAARFSKPHGLAVDGSGNLFVADADNHTIRKVAPDGVVSTVAGAAGFRGDADGVGGSARFYDPEGVAVDGNGNVFVADTLNQTIRKIGVDGTVTTLAGFARRRGSADGTGGTARFSDPAGLAVDAMGSVFVADRRNFTIRKISAGGVVTTLAGTAGSSGNADGMGGAARFSSLAGLAVDTAGVVYVADGSAIRKIASSGAVTTLAGVVDTFGSVDGAGTVARFCFPGGVAVDGGGNVFVADSSNHTIRRISADGVVTTLAGKAAFVGSADGRGDAARFDAPLAIAVGGDGKLYVADTGNDTIRRGISRYAPQIQGQPGNQLIDRGATATFSVLPGADVFPLTFQWRKDGAAIAAATSPTLTLANAQPADAGNYAVVVTNAVASVTSAAASLGVRGAPAITNPPTGQAIYVGLPVIFMVEATGTPAPTFQWFKAGVAIVGATESTLSFVVAAADAGSYTVTATNSEGAATSVAALLSARPLPSVPEIVTQPTDDTALAGEDVEFEVAALADPAPNYQWRKDGVAIVGATKATLLRPGVQSTDTGAYTVVVANEHGSVTSATATLAVAPAAPTITQQPGSVASHPGETAEFEVGARGTVPMHFQWRKNGAEIPGATSYRLTLPNVTALDVGYYSVVVSNAIGTVTSGAAPLALTTPSVTITATLVPDSGYFQAAGGALVLTASLNYAGQPISALSLSFTIPFLWSYGAAGGPDTPSISPRAGTTGSLGFAYITLPANSAQFTLTVNYPAGLNSTQMITGIEAGYRVSDVSGVQLLTLPDLAISPPPLVPVVAARPHDVTVFAGQTATFTVEAIGAGTLSYQWRRNNVAIAGATSAMLALANAQASNAGSYDVVVTNATGSVTSASAMLTVVLSPTITTQPTGRVVAVDTGVTFSVNANGTGLLTYQWRKDGVNLVNDGRITGATSATLSIASVAAMDAGNYSVIVSNAAGSAISGNANLAVMDVGVTHRVLGGGYVAGGIVTISNTATYGGSLSTLGWSVLMPPGWSYAFGGGREGDVKPTAGRTDLLEWAWINVPPSPFTFTYTLNVPAGTTGTQALAALVLPRLPSGPPFQVLAKPDPLTFDRVTSHSADTNRDFRLTLTELLRVIELYNSRNGTVRTGAYKVDVTNEEDGFTAEPARNNAAIVTLPAWHSADSNRDGKLDLPELLRVIELYNYRSGTVRTGEYHVQAGTEDGFAPGP